MTRLEAAKRRELNCGTKLAAQLDRMIALQRGQIVTPQSVTLVSAMVTARAVLNEMKLVIKERKK